LQKTDNEPSLFTGKAGKSVVCKTCNTDSRTISVCYTTCRIMVNVVSGSKTAEIDGKYQHPYNVFDEDIFDDKTLTDYSILKIIQLTKITLLNKTK
jgi:hypothetical protein